MRENNLKTNILLQYSVLTLIIITLLSIFTSIMIVKYLTKNLIETHINLYPDMISLIVQDNDEIIDIFKTVNVTYEPEKLQSHFNDFLKIGNIFRIKVYSQNGTILWSDEDTIIGENFRDNTNFLEALNGSISYVLEEPTSSENLSEKDQGTILEIYTPVIVSGNVIGVIELYETYDYLLRDVKPIESSIYLTIFTSGLLLYLLQFYVFYNSYKRLKKKNHQLDKTKEVTMFALATLAETRDSQTGEHLYRTSEYVRIIAVALSHLPEYKTYFTTSYIQDLVTSAPLHDIGKVGVKDSILLKKGKLTFDEFEEIKTHCVMGSTILETAEKKLDYRSFLSIAIQIAKYHHEKWNGTGYPEGLRGNDIPISARIMALADVYDALRSERPYKKSMTHIESFKIIAGERGEHFDPEVVDVFIEHEQLFKTISEKALLVEQ